MMHIKFVLGGSISKFKQCKILYFQRQKPILKKYFKSSFHTIPKNEISYHLDYKFLNYKYLKFTASYTNLHFHIFINISENYNPNVGSFYVVNYTKKPKYSTLNL